MIKHTRTIQCSKKELVGLYAILRRGTHNTHIITRARILVLTMKGGGKDGVASQLGIGGSTVQRTRDHYRQEGLDRALYDAPRSGHPPKLNEKAEAHLVALACGKAPKGRDHRTLELLQKQTIRDKSVANISTAALWKRLKNRGVKPWREKNVVHTQGNA